MKANLSQGQRVFVALIYLSFLIGIFYFIGGSLYDLLFDPSQDKSLWFYSGALLIALGKYISEPYFTKPTDSLANSLAVIVALLSLDFKHDLLGYNFILGGAISVFVVTLISMALKDKDNRILKVLSKVTYWIAVKIGGSNAIFTFVFIPAVYSYFDLSDPKELKAFSFLLLFWVCIVFFDVVGKLVEFFSGFNKISKINDNELGVAIGCDNPLLYKVEVTNSNKKAESYGTLVSVETIKGLVSVGVIINSRQLLDKKWLSIYLITDEEGNQIRLSSKNKLIGNGKSILNSLNSVFVMNSVNDLAEGVKSKIEENELFKNRERFIGYVENGTNLNTLKFHVLNNEANNVISEGSILSVDVNKQKTLYQLIDGQTREEHLENQDSYGFTIGIARKLGNYKIVEKELEVVPWMPTMYAPVYNHTENEISEEDEKSIAEEAIGRLPNTKYSIPIKDIKSIVTHNTAILGILGIGKSRLTFELIQKTLNEIENLRVICIDITNEYALEDKLPTYFLDDVIEVDTVNAFDEINEHFEHIETIGEGTYAKQIPEKSGNLKKYELAVKKDLIRFLFGTEEAPENYEVSGDKKIKIYNPDYHKVSKGEKMGIHVLTPALSPAEKTKVIVEQALKILMKYNPTTNNEARLMIVFEEAHSLVPEWNSVSNDGDKTAVNGTAKVILQGRKYGLGSMVVTQRTANISKSILNQCNTIFALRVFDDTGKQFLENYIGSDYSNTLPTLEERHAIAVGKGLKLKQPVIIQLNDMNHVIIDRDEEEEGPLF